MLQKKLIFNNFYSKTRLIVGLLTLFFIMVSAFSLVGCSKKIDIKTIVKNKLYGEDAMNTAVAVVDDYFQLLKSGNLEGSFNLISSEDKLAHNMNDYKKELENVTQIIN